MNNMKLLKTTITGLFVIVALVCIALIVLVFVGYGKIVIDTPSDATVYINGHLVANDDRVIKIRPGNYSMTVYSPTKNTFEGNVTIRLFGTTVFKPSLETLNFTALVSSLIGSNGSFGPPTTADFKWLDNNYWLVGSVGPGSASRIALQYSNKAWHIKYFDGVDGYPTDISKLPPDVIAYLKRIGEKYADN